MTDPIKTDHKSTLLHRLAGWWRSRRSAPADASNSVRAAAASMNEAKARTLAGKWPRAANPLDQRLDQLKWNS
jgi:hypothetical protein